MLEVNPAFWAGRRVFLTGHTGFKGAWLHFWLARMGASVTGYSLPPETSPSLFHLLELPDGHSADIRDSDTLANAVQSAAPEIVLHLAAQALVRPSFDSPVDTFATNVVGTAALLDAVRKCPSVCAIVVVTSDKCYENREWPWAYRETDALGGSDPYSASKGAAELVVASMRRSYFAPYRARGHQARIATARAGNVIGGGDWSKDRLIPDIVRVAMLADGVVNLRNPQSVRPWQHVLEPLAAYLGLAERLYARFEGADEAFNFGPDGISTRPVVEVAEAMVAAMGRGRLTSERLGDEPPEAGLLRLDCSKASSILGWRTRWDFKDAIAMTAAWYSGYAEGDDVKALTASQIDAFVAASPYGSERRDDGQCHRNH